MNESPSEKWILLIGLVLLLALAGGNDPQPNPPDPVPDTAPFPADGLSVLVVYETGDDGIWGSAVFVEAMEDMDADRRVLDDDSDMSHAGKPWTDAMNVERESLPWLLVSDGRRGFSGPLPETVQGVIEVVGRFD